MSLPKVSVGVPSYNYSKYIIETLNSVVDQTYSNIELIIVDDCSTDNSVEVINEWIAAYKGERQITFIVNAVNMGVTKACNIILQHASGKYITWLDSDDLIFPDKVEKQVEVLEMAGSNTGFIYSNVNIIDAKGMIIDNDYMLTIGYDYKKMPTGNVFEMLFDFNFVPALSILANVACVKAVGGFDDNVALHDYYIWLMLSKKYEVAYIPENMASYRIHGGLSLSTSPKTKTKMLEGVLVVLYQHYHTGNAVVKKKIKNLIVDIAPALYKFKYPTAKYWLKLAFEMKPGFKTALYYFGITVGISYNFFDKIKSKLK
jgi:glycosyltransferase involved in cell wall biosynthesis